MARRPDVAPDEPLGRAAFGDAAAERREAAGEVVGYAPLIDYDALDARTVVVEVCVQDDDRAAVASVLAERAVSVFEVTGRPNLIAVCRFHTDDDRERFVAQLATDDRVADVTVAAVLRTISEGDARGLL